MIIFLDDSQEVSMKARHPALNKPDAMEYPRSKRPMMIYFPGFTVLCTFWLYSQTKNVTPIQEVLSENHTALRLLEDNPS